jgi:DNA-binding MarR family transcriptional regulator
MTPSGINQNEYQALAEFRYQIRRFLRFSEAAARAAGLEPQQHQLLLAVRGLPDEVRATIGEIAERLQIQHHSTVELVDRMVKRGYVQRRRDGVDRRQVLLHLTSRGDKLLRELSVHHEDELRTLGPELVSSLRRMMATAGRRSGRKAAGVSTGMKPHKRKPGK